MRYFLDTEFNQAIDPVQLISIGIVAEDGREYYAVSSEFEEERCDPWLKEHVLDPRILDSIGSTSYLYDLRLSSRPERRHLHDIRYDLERFISADPGKKVEFWGYYADYDWYLFTRLWGFMNMPARFPKLCLDLKQLQIALGSPKLPPPFEPEHNALIDARWNRQVHSFLHSFGRDD